MTQVISANRLIDGIVVYLAADGTWSETIDAAQLFAAADESEAALATARLDVASNLVIDPFLVSVTSEGGHLRAGLLRDEIRARGPTIDYARRAISGSSVAERS
jgi:hypothetical protein